jgi:hypothetical protein
VDVRFLRPAVALVSRIKQISDERELAGFRPAVLADPQGAAVPASRLVPPDK